MTNEARPDSVTTKSLVMQELDGLDLIYRIHLLKELLTHYQHVQDVKDETGSGRPL